MARKKTPPHDTKSHRSGGTQVKLGTDADTPNPVAAQTTPDAPNPVAAQTTPDAPSGPRLVRKMLTRQELDALGRWAAEAKYADAYTELRERDRKALIARIDPKNELEPIDRALANARAAKAKAASKYISVAQGASQRLGVDVTQYAYDDETGLLSTDPIPK